MTNTEFITKIKTEIEGWLREYAEDSQFELGERYGYKRLLSFLSTLESERLADASKTSPKDLEEAAQESATQYYIDAGYSPFPNVETAAHKSGFIAGAKWQKELMMEDAVKWLVDDDYHEASEKGRFILGSVGLGYNGYYIPYLDLLKLPKED